MEKNTPLQNLVKCREFQKRIRAATTGLELRTVAYELVTLIEDQSLSVLLSRDIPRELSAKKRKACRAG